MSEFEDKPIVMLVHGIWSTGLEMHWMAGQFRRLGYRCQVWRYPSVRTRMEDLADGLARDVKSITGPKTNAKVHYLAHSLGGLVVCHTLVKHSGLPEGRVVTLGSPLLGSQVARTLSAFKLVRPMVGVNVERLTQGVLSLSPDHPVGMIAGTAALGMGQFVLRFRGRNDGTVSVSETRHPDLADHRLVSSSHTGMLRSPKVVRLSDGFFRNGQFS